MILSVRLWLMLAKVGPLINDNKTSTVQFKCLCACVLWTNPCWRLKTLTTKLQTLTVSDSRFSYLNISENESSTVWFISHTSLIALTLPQHQKPSLTPWLHAHSCPNLMARFLFPLVSRPSTSKHKQNTYYTALHPKSKIKKKVPLTYLSLVVTSSLAPIQK